MYKRGTWSRQTSRHLGKIYALLLVHWICAIYQYKCATNGNGVKIGTKEADTI